MCEKPPVGRKRISVCQKPASFLLLRLFTLLTGVSLWGLPICSQEQRPDWQVEVRKRAEAQDWNAALRIVDSKIARAPQDMDVRRWRARVLSWSGRLAEAEKEYLKILEVSCDDPDNWMGLASVYSREGRVEDALRALDRAVQLDPKRADLRAARGRALRAIGRRAEAGADFQKALSVDPTSAEARAGLMSLRGGPRNELRFSQDNDLFNFTSANHSGWISLASQWTPHWSTSFAGSFYERAGKRVYWMCCVQTGICFFGRVMAVSDTSPFPTYGFLSCSLQCSSWGDCHHHSRSLAGCSES